MTWLKAFGSLMQEAISWIIGWKRKRVHAAVIRAVFGFKSREEGHLALGVRLLRIRHPIRVMIRARGLRGAGE
jgi:hypothetical protein